MDSINEELSSRSKASISNSYSEIVSNERVNHRSNSTLSKVVSTTNFFAIRMSASGSAIHGYDKRRGAKGKRIEKLKVQLEGFINDTLGIPIEVLENTLFELAQEYFKEADIQKPILSTFATMHPIEKLIERDDINSEKWGLLLEQYLEFNPNAFREMKFLKKFIQFINDLCIIWDISNIYNYRSRFDIHLEYAEFVNLDGLFSGYITTEVIWLSIVSNSYPLNEIFDENLKRLGLLMQSQLNELFNNFINANKPHISKCESIQPWLSYKNNNLVKEYSFSPPDKSNKPDYQQLKYSWTNAVLRRKTYKLRRELENFEYLFRTFEANFIQSILGLIAYDG